MPLYGVGKGKQSRLFSLKVGVIERPTGGRLIKMTLVSLCMVTFAETRACRTFFPLLQSWRATSLTLTQILADPQIGGAHYLFIYF